MSTARAIADNVHVTARQYAGPHHPLYCHQIKKLEYHNDGSLTCPHSRVERSDYLQSALDYSVALLIVELAGDWQPRPNKKSKSKR